MSTPGSMSVATDGRLRRIESVTDTVLTLDVDEFLVGLLDEIRELLTVDTAAVLLLDPSSQELVTTAVRGIEAGSHRRVRVPVGKGFAGGVAAERQPVIVEVVDHASMLDPLLREQGIRSLLGVPLLTEGKIIGVLHVGTRTMRRFTDDDIGTLQLVADRVAPATRARLSEAERVAAGALQLSLLPARLPVVPGLELAARYVPGREGGVGGDWYDVFTLPTGWLCVVIGDVAGRGLRAAVVMSQLRSALHAYALGGGDPTEVLARLDRKVQHFEPEVMASVLYAMFEPSFDRVHLSSAGHPAPVLALPGRPVSLLDLPIDPPVGASGGLRRRTTTIEMPRGALICMYTDGLVGSREVSLDARLDRLRESVVAGPVESVCTAVMDGLVGGDPPGDDVVVVALRRQDSGEVGPLDLVLPALPWVLRDIRVAVRRWLSAVGAAPDAVADLLIAVGEAGANAVEHAYGPRGGIVEVHLELQAPDVLATVRDTGHWRPPRRGGNGGENRGRGILLMRQTSEELRIDHGPTGTDVVIRRSLAGRRPR